MTDELRDLYQPVHTAVKNALKRRTDRISEMKTCKDAIEALDVEKKHREQEKEAIDSLIRLQGLTESGINPYGVYQLCGG